MTQNTKKRGNKNMNTTKKYVVEIWKTIKNSNYEISNYGNIRHNDKVLKVSENQSYKKIRIKINNNYKTCYIHRLVAEAFIPKPKGKEFINHIDANKHNNNINNLEWCTRSENEKHAWNNGLKEKARIKVKDNLKIARNYTNNEKPVKQLDKQNNIINTWKSISEASRKTGIDTSAISKCCRGIFKQTGGYIWKYTK